jgi:hypothetical protein
VLQWQSALQCSASEGWRHIQTLCSPLLLQPVSVDLV